MSDPHLDEAKEQTSISKLSFKFSIFVFIVTTSLALISIVLAHPKVQKWLGRDDSDNDYIEYIQKYIYKVTPPPKGIIAIPPDALILNNNDNVSTGYFDCQDHTIFWVEWISSTDQSVTIGIAARGIKEEEKWEQFKNNRCISNSGQGYIEYGTDYVDEEDIKNYFYLTDKDGNTYKFASMYFDEDWVTHTNGNYYDRVYKSKRRIIKRDEIFRTAIVFKPLKTNSPFVILHSPWIGRCQLSFQQKNQSVQVDKETQ